MQPLRSGMLFDFDDTLVETTIYFNQAKDSFAGIMSSLGFPAVEALSTLNRFDIRNVKLYGGFYKECFPRALGETYEYYCQACGREINQKLKKEIEEMGWLVFSQPVEPVKNAAEVLEKLAGRFPLYLATRGDPEMQQERIEQSGLSHWFNKIYILAEKNEKTYRRIASEQQLSPQVSWVVGNSMKSDVNPALRAGFKSIYVYHPHTWDYEDELPVGGHVSVDSIMDILWVLGQGVQLVDKVPALP
jgi:putative hydrolase of the HAD superfamily